MRREQEAKSASTAKGQKNRDRERNGTDRESQRRRVIHHAHSSLLQYEARGKLTDVQRLITHLAGTPSTENPQDPFLKEEEKKKKEKDKEEKQTETAKGNNTNATAATPLGVTTPPKEDLSQANYMMYGACGVVLAVGGFACFKHNKSQAQEAGAD